MEPLTKEYSEISIILSGSVHDNLPDEIKTRTEYQDVVNVKGKKILLSIFGIR